MHVGSWVACGKVCLHCWPGRYEGRKPMHLAACVPAACRRMAHPNGEYLKSLHNGELEPACLHCCLPARPLPLRLPAHLPACQPAC